MREDKDDPYWMNVLMMDVSQLGALCKMVIVSEAVMVVALHGLEFDPKTNWKTGTPFANSTLTIGTTTLLLLGLALKQPSTVIAEWTDLSESAVRWWRRKLNEIKEAYNV